MPWRLVALGLAALTLVACPEGEAGAQVPDGWNQVHVEELAYAVPDGFEELDPPRHPDRVVEHMRGDPDDPSELELLGVFENPAVSTTGDEITLVRYVDEMFLVGGRLAEALEGLTVDQRDQLAVEGAVEAELLRIGYFEPRLDERVIQTVVLVRTGRAIYDLRYGSAESVFDEDVASALPGTVHLP